MKTVWKKCSFVGLITTFEEKYDFLKVILGIGDIGCIRLHNLLMIQYHVLGKIVMAKPMFGEANHHQRYIEALLRKTDLTMEGNEEL